MAKKEKLDFLSFTKDQKRNEIFEKFSLIPEKKPKNKQVTIGKQAGNKQVTIGKQTGNKQVTIGKQTGNKQVTKRVTNLSIFDVTGNERKLLDFVFQICRNNGSKLTPCLTLDFMLEGTNMRSKGVLKTTIIRLVNKKGILEKSQSKTGRGGWVKFKIPDHIYQELILDIDDKRVTKRVTNSPSSSINIYTKNITTTTLRSVDSIETSADSVKTWEAIDFSLLEDIGFKEIHISQLLEKGDLTPEEVQESIFAFAYDVKHNPSLLKIKTTPLNLFLGILKRGCPYFPSKEYESEIKKHYEKHKREREVRKLQDQQYLDKHRHEMYSDWVEKLSLKEKSEILDIDTGFMQKMPVQAIRKGLEEYYALKVYEPLGQGLKKGG